MINLLTASVGLGLVVGLLFSETFGLAAGGMVVPGYIALQLDEPLNVALTLLAALVTTWAVRVVSPFMLLYGKRRTVLTILVGYLVGMLGDLLLRQSALASIPAANELAVIGHIIPGLIAIWIERQGLVETISSLLTASVIVRLILILIYGKTPGL